MVASELNISIPEFTVTGIPYGNFFAHKWYLGTDDPADADMVISLIDEKLKILNDDYDVERKHALKAIMGEILPEKHFLDFMKTKGKVGGQHKFPRVLKGKMLEEWESFLATRIPVLEK